MVIKKLLSYIKEPVASAPLAGFRVLFAAAMFFSTLRFLIMGWVADHYILPKVHFHYFGFSWVQAGPGWFMYSLFALMLLACIGVLLGYRYKLSALILFLCFTYTELIDLSYYLNHYYYVSLVCLLLIFLPANRYFSLDVKQGRVNSLDWIPRWMPFSLMALMAIVYTYAGFAKINHDWLIHALPLRIWLPASYHIPVLGPIFAWKFSPWLFSWAGMCFDCCIVFFLWNNKTRPWAYLAVVLFHSVTGILFQIGVFPLVMMAGTLIFFSAQWHQRWMNWISPRIQQASSDPLKSELPAYSPLLPWFLVLFFAFQILFPWRYLLYPGKLFWTEEAYRFSWRVMLVEKAGTAHFYIQDGATGSKGLVDNREFLNSFQEKQMSYQPDMLLEYAHILNDFYISRGIKNPVVTAEVYVTMNGRPSFLLFDRNLNLVQIKESWQPKFWINPYPWQD